jgi:predicted SnoaL-like aldol condensation-catalyzing enzyme
LRYRPRRSGPLRILTLTHFHRNSRAEGPTGHFNKRDYVAAEKFWSPHYIQHSAHIEPGREGLFHLIKNLPPTLKYEPGTILADGDFVVVHGRFSGFGLPVKWIAADILRIESGILRGALGRNSR